MSGSVKVIENEMPPPLAEIMLAIIFSLCVQETFIGDSGVKRPGCRKLSISGQKCQYLTPFVYHSISVTNGFTKTMKDLGKRLIHPMDLFNFARK